VPSVDVSETAKNIVVSAEIPGMDAKDIEVSLDGNVLTLRGERKQQKEEKEENFHRVERVYGSFSRSIQVPAEVDSSKVKASDKRGVLKRTLPKVKKQESKKIEVKAV